MSDQKLYTYVPKRNNIATKGLLSTALAEPKPGNKAWKKYIERVRNYPEYGDPTVKENVLRWLDDTIPGLKRSYAISMLSEPIGDKASDDLKQFSRTSALYSIDPAKLLAAGVITQLYKAHTKGQGGYKVDSVDGEALPWADSKKNSRFLFSRIPHYFVETADGHIPPEYVTKES